MSESKRSVPKTPHPHGHGDGNGNGNNVDPPCRLFLTCSFNLLPFVDSELNFNLHNLLPEFIVVFTKRAREEPFQFSLTRYAGCSCGSMDG